MVEEEALGRGPKGGGKEELGEEEWVSLNNLSLTKTKIWQDYLTSLELKREVERGFFWLLEWKRDEVFCMSWNERECPIYSSGRGNMNGRPFNES